MKKLLLLILLPLPFYREGKWDTGRLEPSPRSHRVCGMQLPASLACVWGLEIKTVLSSISNRHVYLMHVSSLAYASGALPSPSPFSPGVFPWNISQVQGVPTQMRVHPGGAAAWAAGWGGAAGGSGALFSREGGTRAAEAVQTWWRDSAHFLNTERCALMTWTEGRTPGSQVCSQKTGSGRWQSRLPGEAALRSQPPHTHLVTRDGHSPFSFPPQSWRSRKAASAIQLCVNCASHTASSRNRGLMLCKYLLWKLIKCGVDRLGDSSWQMWCKGDRGRYVLMSGYTRRLPGDRKSITYPHTVLSLMPQMVLQGHFYRACWHRVTGNAGERGFGWLHTLPPMW